MLDFNPHCDDSSRGLLCWYNVRLFTVFVPSGFVATEPVLLSCHQATGGCSAVNVLLFLTKIIAMESPKGRFAYKGRKAPNRNWIYDPVLTRLRGLEPTHSRLTTALLKSLQSFQKESFPLPPISRATAVRKTA